MELPGTWGCVDRRCTARSKVDLKAIIHDVESGVWDSASVRLRCWLMLSMVSGMARVGRCSSLRSENRGLGVLV